MQGHAPLHTARSPAVVALQLACLGMALLLGGCATAPAADTSAACLRMLQYGCGTGAHERLFRVSVAADGQVTDVVPIDPQAPAAVARAAQCLRAHPESLEALAARSRQAPPFVLEYGVGPLTCIDVEDAAPAH